MSDFLKKASTSKANTIVITVFVLVVLFSMMKLVENSPKRIEKFKGTTTTEEVKHENVNKSLAGKAPISTEKIFNTFYITVAILFVLVLLLRWYKRSMIISGKGTDSSIKVKDRHYLGAKQSLIIVKIKDRELLLGMTDQNISFLSDLSEYSVDDAQSENFDSVLEHVDKTRLS